MTFRIAFYKGKGNWFNGFIRWWDSGAYSHVELVFSDDMIASAVYAEGKQVRMRKASFNNNWDFIELPAHLEKDARAFYERTKGMKYDLIGQIRFLIAPMKGVRKGYWCSEWCADALGMEDPWRYSPNSLYATLKFNK